MPAGILESGYQEAYDSVGSKKAVAVEGFGAGGAAKAARCFQTGDLNPTWAFLEALLRENPWPVLQAIERIAPVRFEAVPDDPARQRQRLVERLDALVEEAQAIRAGLEAAGRREPAVGRGRAA